jgi:hypothetical protein
MTTIDLLRDNAVTSAINLAWRNSQADHAIDRHEEGGFIVWSTDLCTALNDGPGVIVLK